MLMGGDEKDPAGAGAAKKKPNVRHLPLHHADPALVLHPNTRGPLNLSRLIRNECDTGRCG